MKKLFTFLVVAFLTLNIFAQIPCVVIQWNAGHTAYTVVNYNYNPTSFPIVGIAPDLEVLVKRTPYAIPDYDPRLKYLGVFQTVSVDFDTQYPDQRKWLTTYTLIDRDFADKSISVDEAENDANYAVFPTHKQLKYLTIAAVIIDRKASGLTITAKQQQILNALQAKAAKIWNNHIVGEAKKAELIQGLDVDLDADWENTEPVE